MSGYSGDRAMNWAISLSSDCGGFVTATCPSTLLGSRYNTDPIIEVKNQGSGDCLAANSVTSWVVEMKSCGDTDSEFIVSRSCASDNYCYVVSVKYSDTQGAIGWLCGSNTYNANPTVTRNCSPQTLAQWNVHP
jgi:hypothetical protein